MISVMSNGFEANRRNNSVEETKLRVSTTTSSITPADGSRVAMDVKNSRASNSDSRVSNVENEGNETTKVRDMKEEGGTNSVKANRVKSEQKGKTTALVSSRTDVKKGKLEPAVSGYDLMLSKFDEFAGNGKSWSVGYGFEMGDMVWGKVKSHPWWPGHIFSEAFATPSVRRSKREGHILVAFYGDSSYGWFDLDELVHFEPTFAEKSMQTNVKNFVKAVEEGVDEVGRRSALGLVCHCRKRYKFRSAEVDGFFSVDFSDLEKNCTYSASQIKKARERFQPKETFDFVRKLALKPRSKVHETDLNFVKKKATVLAYRKAVFEEFDPTYAEAFGVIPSKQAQEAVAQPFRQPSSRAPLSGRLVQAETLGKGKSSAKSNKMKDQVEKDRYLFKRRDEPGNLKVQVGAAPAVNSDQPVHLDDSSLSGKDVSPSAAEHLPSASGSTLIEQPLNPAANVEELHGQRQAEDDGTDVVQPSVPTEAKLHAGGSRVKKINGGPDKVKIRKRSGEEVSGGSSPSTERKKKKKKKAEGGLNANSNHVEGQVAVSSDSMVMEKVARESVQVPSASREELQMDIQQKGDATGSSVPDGLVTEDVVRVRSNNIELPQVLSDLHALALDPFYGVESSNIKTIRELFLKFRSLVYQKSLALSAAVESESSTPISKSPVVAHISDTASTNNVKQTSNLKPEKNPARPDDPTKGGRKRGPSDRQEEIAAKKKKKINDVRALAAQKKASLKASEVQQGESKEIPAKKLSSTQVKVSKPDTGKKKEPDPTMLIMKFPPNGALPSIPELKAKFARFGTMDHSATRVFWKSSTCRLVYQYRDHAVGAYRFASASNNLFGNPNVRCYIREVAAEAQDAETTKVPKEDVAAETSAAKDGAADSRSSTMPGQLKSCLKKPPGEEGPVSNGGNGSNRASPRVKFMLEEAIIRGEQTNDSRTVNDASSIADRSASSSSNINNYTTQSSMLPLPTAQYANAPPNDVHFTHQVAHRNVPNYNNQVSVPEVDISQQMLGLLTRCSDIVTDLTGLLGYVPYHSL
nr:PREDICTED: uncharacterized protein LOC107761656 [Nicotiana tabacum]